MAEENPVFLDKRVLELKYQIPIKKIEPFFKALENNKILATRCKSCNTLYFPPQADCSECKKSEMDWVELSCDASLDTFTVINVKPTSFSEYPDYVVAIGSLKEGIKVLAWLNVDDYKKLRIGMSLKLKVVKRKEGYCTYEFFATD